MITVQEILKAGDIIKVQSCHDPEPCCYEVSKITENAAISQPADFKHRYNDILAVYRYNGHDYQCIWQQGIQIKCIECKHLDIVNGRIVYAVCRKTSLAFEQNKTDPKEHFCSLGERKLKRLGGYK